VHACVRAHVCVYVCMFVRVRACVVEVCAGYTNRSTFLCVRVKDSAVFSLCVYVCARVCSCVCV